MCVLFARVVSELGTGLGRHRRQRPPLLIFGATSGGTQGLSLVLHSGLIPDRAGGGADGAAVD